PALTALLRDGRALVCGGRGAGDRRSEGPTSIYDPVGDTWEKVRPMVRMRRDGSATVLDDGTVLVIGGVEETGHHVTTAEAWDPASGPWRELPAGPLPLDGFSRFTEARPPGAPVLAGLPTCIAVYEGGTFREALPEDSIGAGRYLPDGRVLWLGQ